MIRNYKDLEISITNGFKEQGWDCNLIKESIQIQDKQVSPDITLSKNGRVYGYVECYNSTINDAKINQIIYISEQLKPELFILTNGSEYEVYIDGKFSKRMTIPISFEGYSQERRITSYYNLIKENNYENNS